MWCANNGRSASTFPTTASSGSQSLVHTTTAPGGITPSLACRDFRRREAVRHEHEWRVWGGRKLPDGKLLIPGVVSHATNIVEHPQVVADRIVRYAKVVGRENVIAGTDCGLGGRVHSQIAWAKLDALAKGAELASKELWG